MFSNILGGDVDVVVEAAKINKKNLYSQIKLKKNIFILNKNKEKNLLTYDMKWEKIKFYNCWYQL